MSLRPRTALRWPYRPSSAHASVGAVQRGIWPAVFGLRFCDVSYEAIGQSYAKANCVSHETIYSYVYGPDGQSRELARHLPSRRKKRKPRYARRPRGQIPATGHARGDDLKSLYEGDLRPPEWHPKKVSWMANAYRSIQRRAHETEIEEIVATTLESSAQSSIRVGQVFFSVHSFKRNCKRGWAKYRSIYAKTT